MTLSSPPSRHAQPAKQERSLRNVERIISAAEIVLSRDGWDAFTMKAVADEAGASVGGIYRRFVNKEQLLRAIKDNVLTRADAMHRKIGQRKSKDLGGAVEAYVAARIQSMQTYADTLRKVLDAQQGDSVMQNRGRQSVQLGLQTFHTVIAPHRAEISHGDPDVAIEIAFYVFNATILRRMHAYVSEAVFENVDWNVLSAELSRMLLSYLRSAG